MRIDGKGTTPQAARALSFPQTSRGPARKNEVSRIPHRLRSSLEIAFGTIVAPLPCIAECAVDPQARVAGVAPQVGRCGVDAALEGSCVFALHSEKRESVRSLTVVRIEPERACVKGASALQIAAIHEVVPTHDQRRGDLRTKDRSRQQQADRTKRKAAQEGNIGHASTA